MTYQPLIKICGVRTPEILEHVIAQGADMVGFVHYPASPRHADLETIAELIARAGDRIATAILLVAPDDGQVERAAALGPDFLQLHGAESVDRVAAIRLGSGLGMIKALGVADADDIAPVPAYAAVSDRLILDARPPAGADRPGGWGARFDWSLLDLLDPSIAFMLSGGLDPQSVAEAVARVRPFGLDVSSGVEAKRGEKDPALITAFIARARAAAGAGER